MLKYTILIVAFVASQTALFAVESFVYKEGSSDKFFVEQVRYINNGTFKEKIVAIETLRKARTQRALRPLILALKGRTTDSEPTKKQTQEISQNDNYTPINFDIPDNNRPAIKFLAAQALADLGHELAIEPLVVTYKGLSEQVTKDKNQRIYYAEMEDLPAVVAAGEVLRAIGYILETYDIPDVSKDSSKDMAKDPVREALLKSALEVIGSALAHEHYYIRASAAQALRNTNMETQIPVIDAALTNEKDNYTRTVMLASIVGIKKTNSKHFFALLEMLKDPSPNVRIKASGLIGDLGVANAETYLRQAMMIEDNLLVRDQLRKDIGILGGYQIPNAPSASYNTSTDDRDRNKKSDEMK